MNKEQLWEAMKNPTEKSCSNCEYNTVPCIFFEQEECGNSIDGRNISRFSDKLKVWAGKALSKWKWNKIED